jgi:hypothetical protein
MTYLPNRRIQCDISYNYDCHICLTLLSNNTKDKGTNLRATYRREIQFKFHKFMAVLTLHCGTVSWLLQKKVTWLTVITNNMWLSYGIYYSTYVSSSTCFERYVAHHQEPQLYLSLWFTNVCGVRPWCCLSGTPQKFVNQRLKYSWGSWWW